VLELLAREGLLDTGLKFRPLVLPDVFLEQDTPANMYARAGLDARGISDAVLKALGRERRIRLA
jgi:1-deoxy-D-xylulose-5-phosphate synthase